MTDTAAQQAAAQPGPGVLNLDPSDALITIDLGRFKGYVASGVTGLLRIAGGALVAHGLATQGQINTAIGPLTQDIAGIVMTALGQGWAWLREREKNNKVLTAAAANPNLVVVTGGKPNA